MSLGQAGASALLESSMEHPTGLKRPREEGDEGAPATPAPPSALKLKITLNKPGNRPASEARPLLPSPAPPVTKPEQTYSAAVSPFPARPSNLSFQPATAPLPAPARFSEPVGRGDPVSSGGWPNPVSSGSSTGQGSGSVLSAPASVLGASAPSALGPGVPVVEPNALFAPLSGATPVDPSPNAIKLEPGPPRNVAPPGDKPAPVSTGPAPKLKLSIPKQQFQQAIAQKEVGHCSWTFCFSRPRLPQEARVREEQEKALAAQRAKELAEKLAVEKARTAMVR